MRPRLVIIGNGMVATRVIEQLTLDAPTLFDIHVFGAERGGSYNRILLSSWLAGDVDEQEVVTHSLSWYAERNVRVHAHTRVVSLDLRNKQVIADDDSALTYDHLLLATGSYPAIPSVAGMPLRGISSFRTRDDVAQLLRDAGEPTVVVGGGVLGLEAAYGLAMRGAQVTVVHPHAHVMEKQLDAEAGRIVQRQLEERGIRFVCNARCTAFLQATDPFLDEPSVRVVQRILADLARMRDESVAVRRERADLAATGAAPAIGARFAACTSYVRFRAPVASAAERLA